MFVLRVPLFFLETLPGENVFFYIALFGLFPSGMEHAEFNEVYGGYDGPMDAADVHRERTPVHSPATEPN